MQTQFANYLAMIAENSSLSVKFINDNADEEVPKYLSNIDMKYQQIFLGNLIE